ncbi:hypothetical protein [Terasakiella sp. SH-1]|uniref:hypothetical protein n=1 Tax=Terasakiella sp. SH-1 TaxID=2560057 RepID=UPI001074785F|nr:hypothetical protein [Terasakiella sp. SH-1]
MKLPLITAAFTMAFSCLALAQDGWVEAGKHALTDWSEGYVEATGQGTSRYMGNRIQEELMAKQAARTTAQARLLETIKGIRLTGLTTIGTHGAGDTRAATRIKGTLKGAQTIDEKISWHKDKSSRRGEVVMAEVTLRVCISPTCQATPENLTKATLGLKSSPTTQKTPPSTDTSAVIIDLEQAMYLPALSPEVVNESGTIIYSQDTVAENTIVDKGLIHYAKSVEKAKQLEISGPSPKIIKALRITAENQIVVSNNDSDKIRTLDAVKQGRMIVALD